SVRRFLRQRRLRRRLAASAAAIALLPTVGVFAMGLPSLGSTAAHRSFPAHMAPAAIGQLELRHEPKGDAAYKLGSSSSLVEAGRVYAVRHDDIIEGSLQVVVFKPEYAIDDMVDSMTDHCVDNPHDCPGHEI